MLILTTGKPGASKSLNTLAMLVSENNGTRPIFYNNVKLLMLDYDVASSFSGWFYGNYLPRLRKKKNRPALLKLDKIMKRVHKDDEFVTLSDVPWLQAQFDAANPMDTWLYWARKLYTSKQLAPLEDFISNMNYSDLTFKHVERFNLHFTNFADPLKWFALPHTAIIFIDECQHFFPPRAVGAKVPDYISQFETHRHHGYDVYLVTQDRMLLDTNVRRLVGRHIHYHNPFGGNRVTRYEQSKSFDVDSYFDLKNSQKKFIKRPVNFYGAYFSAEMHTHKFKMPKFVYLFIAIVIVLILCIYFLYNLFFSMKADNAKPVSQASTAVHKPHISYVSSSLPSPVEKQAMTEYVSKLVDGVYITGSQYVKDPSGAVHYDFAFSRKSSDEAFDPAAVGMSVMAVNQCLARVSYGDYSTFVTCDPFYKPPVVKHRDSFSDGTDQDGRS